MSHTPLTRSNWTKFAVASFCLLFAVDILATHVSGRLFPAHNVSLLIGAVVSLVVARRVDSRIAVASWCMFVTAILTHAYLFPHSLIGYDPNKLVFDIQRVMETGTTSSIQSGFYSRAAMYHVLSAITAVTTGVTAAGGLSVVPLSFVSVPAVSYALVRRTLPGDEGSGALTAAVLTGTASGLVLYTYWPIPQTIGTLPWLGSVLCLLLYWDTRDWRVFFVLTVFMIAQIYAHKLPLAVFALVIASSVGGYLSLVGVSRLRDRRLPVRLYARGVAAVGIIATLLFLLQWTYLTNFVYGLSNSAQSYIPLLEPATPLPPPVQLAAQNTLEGRWTLFIAYLIVPILCGAPVWAALAFRRVRGPLERHSPVDLMLSATAGCVLLAGVGFVSGGLNSLRVLVYTLPLLAVTVGVGVAMFSGTGRLRAAAGWGLALLFLVSQVFAPVAAPDFAGTPRFYATESELAGKSYAAEHSEGPIGTDDLAVLVQDPGALVDLDQFEPIGFDMLTRNVTRPENERVLYRTTVDVFSLPTPRRKNSRISSTFWRLEYDLERELDRQYHAVYTSGEATVYVRPAHRESPS